MGRNLGLHNQLFGHIAMLAAAVPVYRLDRTCALDRMDEVACLLETAHNAVRMPTGLESCEETAEFERGCSL
jgi:hypothetical protein